MQSMRLGCSWLFKSIRPTTFARRGLYMALWLILAGGIHVDAATMSYLLNGGDILITGTLGGTNFTDARFSLQGTGDPSLVVTGQISGNDYYFIPMTVTMTLTEGATVQTMTLLDTVGNSWGAMSVKHPTPGVGFAGFALMPSAAARVFFGSGGPSGGTPGIYNDMSSPGVWEAKFADLTLLDVSTSLGQFKLNNAAGAFTNLSWEITNLPTAIPEPSSLAIFGIGALSVAYRARRRYRA